MSVDPLSRERPAFAGVPVSGTHAFVCGLSGTDITDFERAYLRESRPWGIILFGRNIDRPDQVRRLTSDVRDILGWHAPVLIDQEGGRVQRLKPPHWRRYPPASRFGRLERMQAGSGVEAAQIAAWMVADDLLSVGVNVNCAPVLDLRIAGGTDAIGNRAFDPSAEMIAVLGRAVAEAYLQAGVVPVFKHIPGHGRAVVDSHFELPRIRDDQATLAASDFSPFRALNDLPMAMTGHLVFEAIDPDNPATLSQKMINLVRQDLGFDGALITDDLSMGALSGDLDERAALALSAGCDIALHCNGVREEMEAVRRSVPLLDGRAADRCDTALSRAGHQTLDRVSMEDRLDHLLAMVSDDAESPDPTLAIQSG